MHNEKYYLLIENGKSCTKGFIFLSIPDALETKGRLETEHKPRKWFIVEVVTTGKALLHTNLIHST
jgi:hypothetical protein